jgi:hypothetical protein
MAEAANFVARSDKIPSEPPPRKGDSLPLTKAAVSCRRTPCRKFEVQNRVFFSRVSRRGNSHTPP